MRNLLRQHLHFLIFASLAAVGLRLFFLLKFPHITDDSQIYADIAKNWLLHGTYARTVDANLIAPTFSRLPGYPAFLAFIFALFGLDNYRAVMIVQIMVDLGTCFIVADLTRRCISDRAAKAAFLLTALCPFFAQYSAAALTETLEIFFTALAMDFAVMGLDTLDSFNARTWIRCGASVGACILLRPDGGLLLTSLGLYLGILLVRAWRQKRELIPIVKAGLLVAACSVAPLLVWGARNFHTLHRVQFLAPRYANEVDEFVPLGFNRWVNTWIADYASTEEIYWNVPGAAIDANNLPSRAFDTLEQREETLQLLEDYNQALYISPELDARFAALAQQRIRAHPLRYYVVLPLLKIADMWLRPRTEMLPPDSRWYEFDDDRKWIVLTVGVALLNLFYICAAAAGLIQRPIAWAGLGIGFVVLRSFFLSTLPNPETRYTLECFPTLIVFASALWGKALND